MTTNEIIFFLRNLILSDTNNQELANIAMNIFNSNENTISENLNAFLPEMIAMDMGEEFYLSKQYMLECLWKLIEDKPVKIVCGDSCVYSLKESIDYLVQKAQSSYVSLLEILNECKDKFNCNDLQTFWFITNFIKSLNMPNNIYSDVSKKWFFNPKESLDIVFEHK